MDRPLHPDFAALLETHGEDLAALFLDLRSWLIDLYPEANELLYHTHALTCVLTPTLKLADGYCHIPVYTKHLNLGFNQGGFLEDPDKLLQGTGKSIRHIPVRKPEDYRNDKVKSLVLDAIAWSINHRDPKRAVSRQVVSKIKKKSK